MENLTNCLNKHDRTDSICPCDELTWFRWGGGGVWFACPQRLLNIMFFMCKVLAVQDHGTK